VEKAIVTGFQGTVAGHAGHFFVATFESEAAVPVVIEFFGQPVHGIMATITGDRLAVGGHLIRKLVPVYVLVATGAVADYSGERHFVFRPLVAGQAIGHRVPAFQGESCHTVVEYHGPPGVFFMAG
jgi:hypothetical protein